MVAKQKSVDSIKAPGSSSVVPAKAGIHKNGKEEPLLNILEPVEQVKRPKIKTKKADTAVTLTEKLSFLRRHHKSILITLATISLVILTSGLIVGGAYAYEQKYNGKILPGVQVWGMDAGGKTGIELQQLITNKIKTYKITIKGPDQEYQATASDLGVNYDSEATLTKAFAKGRTGSTLNDNITRARLLVTTIKAPFLQELTQSDDLQVTPTIMINDEKFNQYVSKITENINITAQDSEVKVTDGQIQLKPAIYGREVKIDDLKAQVRISIADFSSEEILVQTAVVKPAIIDTAAQEVMVQAQNVMQRPIVLTYMGTEYRPNQETIASWISFTKNTGDTSYTLVVDPSKMDGYFEFLGTKINVYSVPRKVRVENGVKETETQAGQDGLLIDEQLLGKQIAEQLPVQSAVRVAIPTYVASFKTEYDRVIIANWAKYIDVNLTTQTMTACEKGGVNCRQWYVMTGKNSTPTPVGTWLVLDSKRRDFYMYDQARTFYLWVPYATFFRADGYAIHSAQWRNNDINDSNGFGNQAYTWNGSHGCVNAPDDAAEYIYYWADVGTPVIVHY